MIKLEYTLKIRGPNRSQLAVFVDALLKNNTKLEKKVAAKLEKLGHYKGNNLT